MKITTLIRELDAVNTKQMTKKLQNRYPTIDKSKAKEIACLLIEYKGKLKSQHPTDVLTGVIDQVQDRFNETGLELWISMK